MIFNLMSDLQDNTLKESDKNIDHNSAAVFSIKLCRDVIKYTNEPNANELKHKRTHIDLWGDTFGKFH